MNILKLIGRDKEIFDKDIQFLEEELTKIVGASSFLVIGGLVLFFKKITLKNYFFHFFGSSLDL
jgi:hypothetical protein